MRPNSRRFAGAAAAAAVLLATVTTATAANAANTSKFYRAALAARPGRRRAACTARPSSTTKVSFSVALPLRNEAEAEACRRPPCPTQGSRKHGHTDPGRSSTAALPRPLASVTKVKAYLRGAGLSGSAAVAQGNRWVSATGTVSQVNLVVRRDDAYLQLIKATTG